VREGLAKVGRRVKPKWLAGDAMTALTRPGPVGDVGLGPLRPGSVRRSLDAVAPPLAPLPEAWGNIGSLGDRSWEGHTEWRVLKAVRDGPLATQQRACMDSISHLYCLSSTASTAVATHFFFFSCCGLYRMCGEASDWPSTRRRVFGQIT
jgi:hypothetical protein